ncbi:hypothetical protein GGI11_003097 [Coemansia sp. RSA 2049]|nr:hypothetical protein GGI11_003097 [Coemansia sp. RSA 2049]
MFLGALRGVGVGVGRTAARLPSAAAAAAAAAGIPKQHRAISTFQMDNTVRGRLRPYVGMLKLVSAVSGLLVLGVGGFYVALNQHLDTNWPPDPRITSRETRRLLRGAAMREHVAPDPQMAYVFLLHALQQVYRDGVLSEHDEPVQELQVRLARAASLLGERKPAMGILLRAWRRVVDDLDRFRVGLQEDPDADGAATQYGEDWVLAQVCRVAEVLGPMLLLDKDHALATRVYGTALRAAKTMGDRRTRGPERQSNGTVEGSDPDPAPDPDGDRLRLRQINYATSLGEAFAIKGDLASANLILRGVLHEISERSKHRTAAGSGVDGWTCLDAVVMLDLAQVAQQAGELDEARAWADSGLLAVAKQTPRPWACDNCQGHLMHQLGAIAESRGDRKAAAGVYSKALDHCRATGTGNIEQIKAALDRLNKNSEHAEDSSNNGNKGGT